MESLFIQLMYKSQSWKIDTYEWFCGPVLTEYCVYLCIYKYTHICMYIFMKNMLCLYIKYIYK